MQRAAKAMLFGGVGPWAACLGEVTSLSRARAVVQSACVGVACVPWRARGLRACRGVRGGSRACRGREPPERLLRDTAASKHG